MIYNGEEFCKLILFLYTSIYIIVTNARINYLLIVVGMKLTLQCVNVIIKTDFLISVTIGQINTHHFKADGLQGSSL